MGLSSIYLNIFFSVATQMNSNFTWSIYLKMRPCKITMLFRLHDKTTPMPIQGKKSSKVFILNKSHRNWDLICSIADVDSSMYVSLMILGLP